MKKKRATIKTKTETTIPFLFEIGVEELPAVFIQPVIEIDDEGVRHQCTIPFVDMFHGLLRDNRIAVIDESLTVLVTPRRITFTANIASHQEEKVIDSTAEKGPPVDIAYKNGQPTKAYYGYLKKVAGKYGVAEKDIKTQNLTIAGREYVTVFGLKLSGEKVSAVLPGMLEKYIKDVTFPKNMRWDQTGITFPRPIRWIVAYVGNTLLRGVKVGTVKNSATSYGHRFLGKSKITIKSADRTAYKKTLKEAGVIVDEIFPAVETTERETLIIRQIAVLCKKRGIDEAQLDKDLIKTVANLVECPHVFVGDFKKEYLSLPKEVLSASMKKHQKTLACYNKRGEIIPHFIAVINGKRPAAAMTMIKKNYENVLESRLRDAQFFYAEDTKTKLADKVEKLKGIVFLGKLGTVFDKVKRLEHYASRSRSLLSDEAFLSSEEEGQLCRAATLCKADLVTAMVYEFPDLQGLTGKTYALFDGEGPQVAAAVFEHYLPRSKDDELPRTKIGALLGIFDKIDTLCGAFSIGLEPTGSQDPYALRRAAIGLIRILRAREIPLSLATLLDVGCSLFTHLEQDRKGVVCRSLMAFLEDKIRLVFEETGATDEMKQLLSAAMATSYDTLVSLDKRYQFLQWCARKKRTVLQDVAKICERTANIIKADIHSLPDSLNESLLTEPVEQRLYKQYMATKDIFMAAYGREDFATCLAVYAEAFSQLVHEFFDTILVNVDDAELRVNRKILMKLINKLITGSIADMSVLRLE